MSGYLNHPKEHLSLHILETEILVLFPDLGDKARIRNAFIRGTKPIVNPFSKGLSQEAIEKEINSLVEADSLDLAVEFIEKCLTRITKRGSRLWLLRKKLLMHIELTDLDKAWQAADQIQKLGGEFATLWEAQGLRHKAILLYFSDQRFVAKSIEILDRADSISLQFTPETDAGKRRQRLERVNNLYYRVQLRLDTGLIDPLPSDGLALMQRQIDAARESGLFTSLEQNQLDRLKIRLSIAIGDFDQAKSILDRLKPLESPAISGNIEDISRLELELMERQGRYSQAIEMAEAICKSCELRQFYGRYLSTQRQLIRLRAKVDPHLNLS